MARLGIKPTIPVKDRHREERLQFAQEHLQWDAEKWGAVIWSDDKTFKSTNNGCCATFRSWGQRANTDSQYTVQTRLSDKTYRFWGTMSAGGLMAIRRIKPRMHSEEYVELLDQVMLPCARQRFPEADYPVITFMQGHSAIHTSRSTMAWLEKHPEIKLMNWPHSSSDLNPMNGVWSVIVKEWHSKTANNRDEFGAHVNAVWDRMREEQDLTRELVNSVQKRMRCVIEHRGFAFQY